MFDNKKMLVIFLLLTFVLLSLGSAYASDVDNNNLTDTYSIDDSVYESSSSDTISNSVSDLGDSDSTSDDLISDSGENSVVNEENTLETKDVSTDPDDSDSEKENDNKNDANSENIKDEEDGADEIDINIESSSEIKNILKADEDHIIYVSPFGPDDADGTMLKSYNSIQKALDSITGDGHYTIVLRNGNYTGVGNTQLNINRDNITIKAYDNAKPVIEFYNTSSTYSYMGWNITGSNIEVQGITFNHTYGQSAFLRILNTHDVNVSGCNFGNTTYGNPLINVTSSNNVNIENSNFYKTNVGSGSSTIFALRSNITVNGCNFENSSNIPIRLNYSNAEISNNVFNNVASDYLIFSDYSNSTISANTFENRKTSSYSYRAAVHLGSSSNSTISGNTFKNITNSYSSNGYSTIYSTGSSFANISDNDFVDTYAYYGGAINIASPNNIIENNRFVNTSAYYGGAIYNTGTNLTLTGNTITGSNATQGKNIHNNGGTLNSVNVTLMNNETLVTDSFSVDVSVLVTDDMGNEIYGKTVPVKLNGSSVGTVNIVDSEVNITISNPGEGIYLVNGNYTGALNSNVKTGVIEFLDAYEGPFYVSTDGSDSNNGDADHPFASIAHAIKAASQSGNVHAIFINEGTYYESNLNVSTSMNITGLGDVTIDGKNGGRIMNVSGSNVNISNIKFENANCTTYNTINGGALYWGGLNGTLNNASFSNNLANVTGYYYVYGGAVSWAGANGVINNTKFENNLAQGYSYSANGGAVYWSGVNGTIANSTFDNNTASCYASSYSRNGGAVYWTGQNGTLEDNTFNGNTAYYGATIYNNGQNLALSGNEINDPNGTYGKYIYTSNYGSINGAIVTILNNSTLNTTQPYVDCLVTVTDDMGNPIYGGLINVTVNGTNKVTGTSIYENTTVTINSPGVGEYLVAAKYYHSSAGTLNDNYLSKTAVINWTEEPYYGPYYVAEDGSDDNSGDEEHPFATIEAAIKAASLNNVVPAIYVKEGTYKENDLNITKPMNITGLGNVVIDGENKNDILNVSAHKVNISNIKFINGNSSSDGGAIYWSGNNGTLKDCSFENNTAANRGGAIFNNGTNLTLSGNSISDCNASMGRSIYNNGSINGTTLILLNNDTVVLPEGVTAADVSVKLVDDMGNSIAGGYVNITLNNHKAASMINLTDDLVVTVFSPAYGEYLVNGSYRTVSASSRDLNNYTVQTGSLTFLAEPYFGPYYVAENGSDYNDGSQDHPFATIEQAIKAASQSDVVPAIFINEGVYNESNLNITKPMNITGLGDVTINANNSGYVFDVKGNNVNISNVEFANANKTGNGAAVTWSGTNGTLNNATFINNTASGNAGAIYWTGANGTLSESTFINNTAGDRGGALVYVGNLDVTNNTFINNTAVNEGGAIFTNKTSPLDMANSTFINNSARLGGAIFVDYNNNWTENLYNNTGVNIADSTFINNSAQSGGAIVLYASNSTVSNSTFIGNNATHYGDGAISSGGENNTIINNTFINNTALNYAGAIGSNGSQIINNTFINNSAYQGGAILTINDTIINNTFIDNDATIGPAIVYLQNYNLTNRTCNCSVDNYECCDENCSCHLENFTGICNCTDHVVYENYTVLIDNDLPDGSVYAYKGDLILNVTLNYNGHYFVSRDGFEELGAGAYCIEMNNSMPWQINGTTGILVNNLSFIRNSLDGSYVGDYVRVAILLYQSNQRWNIKELIFAFTDGDYMNSDDPDVQHIIEVTNREDTILNNGDNWINGTWYCGNFTVFVHPTTRQNLILINGCGDYFDLPHLSPEKVANVTSVADGDYINYTVTITNDEEIYLHNVTVKDIPDSSLIYVDWINSIRENGAEESWIKDEDSLTWYLNRTLLPGETAVFNIIFKANVYFRGINNTAYDIPNTINATSYETNWDADEEVVQAIMPYLIIRKDTLDTNVSVGDPIRFLITVTNIGQGNANLVNVTDSGWSTYGLSYLGWTDGFHNRTWTHGPANNQWILNGPLAPNESASLIVIFNATNPGTMYSNTAIVTNPNGPTEMATNYTNISYVYLGAYKTVVEIKDDIITFALTVSNNGNATARGVFISESNSYAMPLVNWTDSRGSSMNSHWNYNGPSIGYNFTSATWTLQDPLGPGGTATILLTLNTTYSSGYGNSITVGDQQGSKNGTGISGPLTRYLGAYKTVVDQTGDIITFALTVTNQGNITAHNVYIYDTLTTYGTGPMTLINWTDSRGSYMNSHWIYSGPSVGSAFTGSVRWELQDPLGPGGSATILLNLNTTNATGFSNSMNIGEKNGFGNGTGLGDGLIRYLGAHKTVLTVKDDIIQFMLTVTNQGNITAHDVYILDSLYNPGNGRAITLINWTDSRGSSYNNVWNTNFYTGGSYYYYNFTYKNPLGPGGAASVILTFNTTNASGYSNGITVGEKNGFTNGTGTGDGLTRYLGAYKTVLEQEGDTIKFLLTVTNQGNITANDVRIQDSLYRGITNGRICNLTYIGWEDYRGANFNSDWRYDGSRDNGNYTYYNFTFLKPLNPGASASIVLIFNTSNATGYSNGMSVTEKNGYGNGTGITGNITRDIGAYKYVVNIEGEIITFALTVTNNGNTTLDNVYIYDNPSSNMPLVNWSDVRGSQYNSEWTYSGPSPGSSFSSANWKLNHSLDPGASATILLTLNTSNVAGYSNSIIVNATGISNGTGTGGPLNRYLGAYKTVLEQKDDTISFMLTVTNQGNITAHDVYISDTLTTPMQLINWTDSRGPNMNSHWNYNGPSIGSMFSGNVRWTLQDALGPGGSASIIITLNTTNATGYSNGITVGERNGFTNGTGVGNGIWRYLSATKVALDNNTNPGEIVRFRLIVTNVGNTTADGVYIKDVFTDAAVFVDWNDTRGSIFNSNWTFDSENSTWTYLGLLNPGAYASIDVAYNVTEEGIFNNTITVGDKFGSKNETSVNVTVFEKGMEIIKISNNPTAVLGDLISFTIKVSNTGHVNLTDVFVRDPVPAGATYVKYENTSGNWIYDEVDKWTYDGELGIGETVQLTLFYEAAQTGLINNTATVGSNQTPNMTANNTTKVLGNPDLTVIKVTLNETVIKGQLTEFNITVTNIGDCDLTGVNVVEQIPEGLVYYGFVDDTNMWYNNGNVWIYNGTLAVGESATFTIIFNTTRTGTFTNVVVARSNETSEDKEAENKTTVVFNPQMEIVKIANDEYVYLGNTTSYTIIVSNTGETNLTHVFIDEILPDGLVYVDYENTSGNWYICREKWVYDGVLEPGETAELTIIFNTTKTGVINNSVTGGSEETPNQTVDNNTTVVLGPSLEVEKTAENKTAYIGDLVEFTITVTNTGDCELTEVFVKEQIPDGLMYIDYVNKTGNWIYDGVDTWTYDGKLDIEESAELLLIFNVTQTGKLTNVVVAGSNITDNVTANDTTTVYHPDFELTKVANDEYVYAGNTTSFTIAFTNTGDCELSNVVVKENIPEELIYLDYVNKTGNWIYDGVDTWTYDGTLAVGETAEFTVIFNTTKSTTVINNVTGNASNVENVTVTAEILVLNPSLTVEKIALNESVYKGHLAHFMVVVTNTGDCNLTNVFVEDTWPNGLIGVGFLDDTGKWYNHGNRWIYDGELGIGESSNFTVIFYANASGNYTNVVVAGSNITGNETDSANTTVYTPSLEVNKTANDEIVYVGNSTSYTITITNTGDVNLTNIFIDEIAPEDIEYLDYINKTGRWIYEGVLEPGETAEIVLIYNTLHSGRIKNRLIAGSDETEMEITENNTTVVYSPKMEVQKISNNKTVYKGNTSEFTIVVRNTGDCELTGVFVKEVIPSGLRYVNFKDSTGKWSYNKKTKTFTYRGALGVNETSSFTVVFNTTKTGKLTNTVIAGSDITGNSTAKNTTNVLAPGLEVQKITLNETVNKGEQTQFLIVVTNNGDCDLTGVYVIEKSFPGLKYGSYIDETGDWSFDGKNKWTYKATLKPGQSVSFIVIFDTDKVGNFTNTVVAGSDQTGQKEANNTTEVIDKSNKKPVDHVKHNLSHLESIKAGNPIFALLLVLAILGIVPVYRKRD